MVGAQSTTAEPRDTQRTCERAIDLELVRNLTYQSAPVLALAMLAGPPMLAIDWAALDHRRVALWATIVALPLVLIFDSCRRWLRAGGQRPSARRLDTRLAVLAAIGGACWGGVPLLIAERDPGAPIVYLALAPCIAATGLLLPGFAWRPWVWPALAVSCWGTFTIVMATMLTRHTAAIMICGWLIAAASWAMYRIVRRTMVAAVLLRHENAELISRLGHDATHDPLTGLRNRAGFFTEAGMLAEGCRSTGEELTIVFVDLDRFKAVNDRYGHSAGDRVLTVVAERLVDGLPPEALVARLAGDEFVAAITGPPPPAEVLAALGAALRRPIPLGGTTVEIDATFGIDTERGAATDLDALLASSDEMMLARKRFRAEPRRSA